MGNQLRVLNGPLEGTCYSLEQTLTIGRAEQCDVILLLEDVSRRHACVTINDDGRHVLVDLGSMNGVFVGEEKTMSIVLTTGMEFEIGPIGFVYEHSERLVLTKPPIDRRRRHCNTNPYSVAYEPPQLRAESSPLPPKTRAVRSFSS